MVFTLLNSSGTLGIILKNGTNYTTGSMGLTLFIVFMIILAIALLFGIALEFAAIIILPLLFGFVMAAPQYFLPVLGVVVVYLSMIIAKNFFTR